MADPASTTTDITPTQPSGSGNAPPAPARAPDSPVISGTERFLDNASHVGVAVLVSSDGNPSTLMIPDVTGVTAGTSPVYITKPIVIDGKNLRDFLKEKKVDLPAAIGGVDGDATKPGLIATTKISCDAFYYTANGPLLMMFALNFDDGLIGALTGDASLGKLFDIKGASVRIFKCAEKDFPIIQQYVARLTS